MAHSADGIWPRRPGDKPRRIVIKPGNPAQRALIWWMPPEFVVQVIPEESMRSEDVAAHRSGDIYETEYQSREDGRWRTRELVTQQPGPLDALEADALQQLRHFGLEQ